MTTSPDAFSLIVGMLRRSFGETPSFPPTELFSEGWMLRLLLEATFTGHGGMPFEFADQARWYSEARLPSAFAPRFRSDPHGEGFTHADGVVGHFSFRSDTTAGLALAPNATQFVVIEAKMGSRLAGHTSKVAWFDQAARNVAAMAWTIHQAEVPVDQLQSLAFLVMAPRYRLDEETTFAGYTAAPSIGNKIDRRIGLYQEDAGATLRLEGFHETAQMLLDRLDLRTVAWEDMLDRVDEALQPTLRDFYKACLTHNQPAKR